MARLNQIVRELNKTQNISGHAAYVMDDKTKLATMALTTLFAETKFYGDNSQALIALAEQLCRQGEGAYVAKLAVWARTKGNLRTVSHVLAAVVAHECSGEDFVRPMVRVIASQRGDDGTEMLATHAALYGSKVRWPHALQRGIRDALEQMGAYQIAKYQSAHREFKMRDTLRICHPMPRDVEAAEAMNACVERTLAVSKGWETELSERGNTAEVWNELLAESHLGYMAVLRNLRNIITSGASVAPALGILGNPSAVRRSRQLPFRFYSAWRELKAVGLASTRVTRTLDQALVLSCENVEPLHGRTAVLVDTSGSMSWCLSGRSKVVCRDTAAVLAALLTHISDDAWVCRFDTTASPLAFMGTSVLADIEAVPAAGGSTNMAAGFDCLMESGFDADRVVVLSDNEVNGRSWMTCDFGYKAIQSKLDQYRAKVGHDVWCHAIDLQGYGTQQFIGAKVNIMGGWSEQVLHFVALAEQGLGGLVDEIEAIEL